MPRPDDLPPGVSESMIPGNRPEDVADDDFWDAVYKRLLADGVDVADDAVMDLLIDDPIVQAALGAVRVVAYDQGYADGRAEPPDQETV